MRERRVCIGFGPYEGKCENIAGTPWTSYWCPRCDQMRRDHISKRFNDIVAKFKDKESEGNA